jgi:nicotinate-nucleotide pyrophosphorylase (carboxylating)
MLDNMDIRDIKKAVELRKAIWRNEKDRPALEASGNITLHTIAGFAAAGIDYISLGTITKDIDSLDFSLEVHTRRKR